MSDVKVEFHFVTTLNQMEFSVMTRSLAGHQLTPDACLGLGTQQEAAYLAS